MNYHLGSKNKRKTESSKKFLIIGILIALVSFIFFFGFSSQLFGFGKLVWSGEEAGEGAVSRFLQTFESKSELIEKINSLEQERDRLKLEILEKESISLALGSYIRDIGIYSSSTEDIVAKIIRRPPDSPFDTLVLDRGEDNGIRPGMMLIWSNTRVGVISEVISGYSIARLYSSPKEKFKVIIGEASFEATAEGMGGGYFVIEIPRDIDVKENDIVRDLTRQAMLFGTVYKVEVPESGTMKKAYVKLPFPIYEAEWIKIVENNDEE